MNKAATGKHVFDAVNVTVFLIFTFICIFPFYYIFINSISENTLASTGKVLFYPVGVHWDNYTKVLSLKGIPHATLVSVARTVLGTILTLIGSAFLGYAFCKPEYWKRKFWYRFVVVAMYFNAGVIPWFVTMKLIGLYNNFLAYILPSMVSPFYVILFKTYVESIPTSLEESVEIDGGGYLVRFTRIILPLSKPILATIAVFSCASQWNSFTDTLFLARTEDMYTLQFILYQFLNQINALANLMKSSQNTGIGDKVTNSLSETSVRMTITFVITVPILCVYPFMQRYFVKGIMIGAVKG